MSLWRNILRVLGLSSDARVHISAPGIEVVLTGEPEQVRALLGVVKHELERNARATNGRRRLPSNEEQIVRPTELDEMDSPYALPEARVLPVGESQITDEQLLRAKVIDEAQTLLPEMDTADGDLELRPSVGLVDSDDRPKPEVVGTRLDSQDDEPEPEVTAVAENPSGPNATPSPSRSEPEQLTVEVHSPPRGTRSPDVRRPEFVTDSGPTLMPKESSTDEAVEVHDSDVSSL